MNQDEIREARQELAQRASEATYRAFMNLCENDVPSVLDFLRQRSANVQFVQVDMTVGPLDERWQMPGRDEPALRFKLSQVVPVGDTTGMSYILERMTQDVILAVVTGRAEGQG